MLINFKNNFLENLDYQHFDAGNNIKGFSIESASTRVWFSIVISIDELKPVVAEKSQFEKRDTSITMAFFTFFGLQALLCKTQNHPIFKVVLFHKLNVSD